jgi:L-threonylcarbamoyladenylate synthase
LRRVIDAAAEALARGEVVVIPTDTVYGVAVAASVPGATQRLFAIKERPSDVPLPVLVADAEQAAGCAAKVPAAAKRLMARWWPGGLTIVLLRAPAFDVDLGGDGTTVGLRVPDHDVPRELARRVGPLVTTSANRHGRPTPPDAAGVAAELGAGVAVVVDGGVCAGEPSTVVSCVDGGIRIVRQGAIPGADIVRS